MTTLTDFLKVDGVDYPLAEYFNFLYATALRAEMTNTLTISATKELSDNDVQFQVITASGADRTVELAPEAASNHITVIYNAGGSNNVLVKDDSGAITFMTLLPSEWVLCIPIFGQTWKVILQTPSRVWTPTTTGITLGNGTLTSSYSRQGDQVNYQVNFLFGSTSAITGDVTFTPPIAPVTVTTKPPMGEVTVLDAGVGNFYGAVVLGSSPTIFSARVNQVSGSNINNVVLSSTVPMTWAVNDELNIKGSYRC